MRRVGIILLTALATLASRAGAQAAKEGRLSREGVVRATATVDSVFVSRTAKSGRIQGGDWGAYLLARLGAGPIPDTLAILIGIDTAHIEVHGRLQDLPLEARRLLGPLATMVDSSTVVAADVALQRTGREVVRFYLRGIKINGFPFPEFLLGPMMTQVGRQYPALTASGRDLYVQIPPDGTVRLGNGEVLIATVAASPDSTRSTPPGR